MVFPYWNCNCHLELCHYWNGHSIATYQFWMWYQQFWLTTHLFELGLRLALPARLQAFSASWKMWRLRWQPSMLIPIFNGKNGKMIYEWRRFYWHVGLVEGFLRVKISMSTQQHGVRTNRDMSIAQRNAGFMYLFEYGDISIPLLVVVATLQVLNPQRARPTTGSSLDQLQNLHGVGLLKGRIGTWRKASRPQAMGCDGGN